MDDQLKDVVKAKFNGFEAPVDDELWAGIKKDIETYPSNGTFVRRGRWVMLVLLLIVSITGWQWVQSSSQENSQEFTKAEQPKNLTEGQTTGVESSKPELVTKPINKEPNKFSLSMYSPHNEVVGIDRIETEGSQSFKPSLINHQIDVQLTDKDIKLVDIDLLSLTPYQAGNYTTPINGIGSYTWVSDSTYFQKPKPKSNLVFGLNFNYLNFSPNPADQVYFEDIDLSFDVSLNHLGLGVGYQRDYQLAYALKLRSVLSATLMQYKLSLNYIEDASDSENDSFTEFKSTFRPLSVGISTGLQYDLTKVGIDKKEIDLGLTYEVVVSATSDSESLVRYPKNQLMLNFGVTSGLAKTNWKLRVYGYHSLNRKFSDAPMHLTPFGFGLQFFKK